MTAPQTTVVVPVWDAYVAELLPEALASIQGQDARPQILVVDNASAVSVGELGGVRVVRADQRLSLGSARNLGLAHVNTPYVVFWDADDVMLPGTVAFLEAESAAHPEVVAFALGIMEEPSGKRHRHPRRWAPVLMQVPRAFALAHCIWSLYPTTGATLIDAELARAAGGFGDADSGEDWCLGVSLAFRGRIGFSARPGRVYRVHQHSMWTQHMTTKDQLRHAWAVRERICADRAVPGWVRAMRPLIADRSMACDPRARGARRPARYPKAA